MPLITSRNLTVRRGPVRRRRAATAVAAGALLVAGLTACGAGGGSSSSSAGGGVLTIGTGGVFTANNNPFVPTSSAVANGWNWLIYEPLVESNSDRPTATPQPWLASSYTWSPDTTSVTFTARTGVKWSDGKPFTAADIAYTFNLIKDNSALNPNSLPISAVTTSGDTATVSFSSPQFVNESKITSQFVVPQHIWSAISNPATYQDPTPVGTGPFEVKSITSSVAKLSRNTSYWQADKVKVGTVIYQALQDNDAILNALAGHKLDWASSFALNEKSGFTDKDPKQNLAWNVPKLYVDAFIMNSAEAPFNDPVLRKAISLVISTSTAARLATGGLLAPVTSVTGLPQPVGDSFITAAYQNQTLSPDVARAKSLLTGAGYRLAGGVLSTPGGKPVTMTLTDPTGWTDYLTELQVIGQELAQIGIKSSVSTPSADAWNAALASGKFDAAMLYSGTGSTPYNLYGSFMDGSGYKPIGATATTDYNRFRDPAATKALQDYAGATTDAARATALAVLQKIWVQQTPAVSVIAKSDSGMFTTVNWTGWPSAANPYASPEILDPNILKVLTTIRPAG